MKKIIALTLVLFMALSLAGCCFCIPAEKCELCESNNAEKEIELGYVTYKVCSNCYDMYNYDYDSYYNDSYDSGNDGSDGSYCWDCGAAIASDRFYCDDCLGYGTCQDCGKSIDDDRLYCDVCLGFGTCQECGRSIDDDRLYCDSCLYD